MKIVADERIAALDSTFSRHGELVTLPGRDIRPTHLRDADALITRTVTEVNQELLDGSSVRFVGTATIGTDHLDTCYLDNHGTRWSAAPGCNAHATSQYTLAIYFLACRRLGLDPLKQSFGIVGYGNVGGRLRKLLQALNIDVIACDPPLEAAGAEGFRPMSEIVKCDVISLHVPLTRSGHWPTYQMFDESMFEKLSSTLLINACRGDVIEASSLKDWVNDGGHVALDVWPGEPDIDPRLIELATVASPHIAGYSLEGKLRATSMVYREFCDHFGLSGYEAVSPPSWPELEVPAGGIRTIDDIVLNVCPIERDDEATRQRLGPETVDRISEYDALRSHYPERRDFSSWTLKGLVQDPLASTLKNLGFSITNH